MTHQAASRQQGLYLTLFLCFCVAMLEGFDIQSMGVAGPFVKSEFDLSNGNLAWIFSAATLGMFPGAVIAGRLADRYGRKKVLIVSVFLFGIMSLATAYCEGVIGFTVVRFLTGLGMGGALPMMIAVASESVPPRWSSTAVSIMYSGVPIGAAFTALMAGLFSEPGQWKNIFYIGGLTPLVLLPVLMLWLQETARISPAAQPVQADFKTVLFAEGRWVGTVQVWLSFFCTLIVLYFLLNWLPVLMRANGIASQQVAHVQLAYQLGAAVGVLVLGWMLDRVNIKWVVILIYTGMLAGLSALALSSDINALILSAAFCGVFLTGGQSALYALAALVYPTEIRGTGVGVAVAMGRIGSFVGPLFAGAIIAISSDSSTVIAASIPIIVIAALAAIRLATHLKQQSAPKAQLGH